MTDRANCGEIKLKHCLTMEMLGDYFTKPLQGGLFTKFRDRILNVQADPSIVPPEDHRSVLGQGPSHATDQSHGQSQTPIDHDQGNQPKPAKKMMEPMTKQDTNKHNVPPGMTPMSQPVGGWHVTSMTGQGNATMSTHRFDDHADNRIDSKFTFFNESGLCSNHDHPV